MSDNKRIFYETQAVGIQPFQDGGDITAAEMVHGLQSVGMNTTFNLEQAFELGQIEIYENIDGTPDVEVTTRAPLLLETRGLVKYISLQQLACFSQCFRVSCKKLRTLVCSMFRSDATLTTIASLFFLSVGKQLTHD